MAAAATCLPHFFTVTAASTFFPRLDVGISEKKHGIVSPNPVVPECSLLQWLGVCFPQDDRAQLRFTGVSIVMGGTPKDG